MAQQLQQLVSGNGASELSREDLDKGLELIAKRSESLTRFLSSYARLARLPPPKIGKVDVPTWVQRVARLETRVPVAVTPGPAATLRADGDQLDQLLINLITNAADAALTTGGGVRVRWGPAAGAGSQEFEVVVEDDGPGLPETSNLFVPFFTTKPTGSGIGLVLSRQIAEAHGGRLTVANRTDGAQGCVAKLVLPSA